MTQTLEDKISDLDFMKKKNREEKINNSVSGKEDVKLPEVGKRYRANYDNTLEAEIEYISKNKEVVMSKLVNVEMKITLDENKIHSMDKFIKYFVELPEDNIEKLEIYHCKQCKKIIPNELAEGGEVTICSEECWNIFKNKPFVKEVEKPKSIWKDVSELPETSCQAIIKCLTGTMANATFFPELKGFVILSYYNNGDARVLKVNNIKEYVILKDYINNTEERLKKLEGK